jgi:hypothetical protein
MRRLIPFALVAVALVLPGSLSAQNPAPAVTSIGGLWTLNKDLSDQPSDRAAGGDDGQRGSNGGNSGGGGNGGGGGGGRRRGGGGGGGGYGRGGGGGGGMGRGAVQGNPEDIARMRDAMRDITNPSEHLAITQTETMVVLTAADGRTTRLSPDGKKVKDDNTKVERKTKWDGGKLVSEINGLGPSKMMQTFSVDPEGKQLRIIVVIDGKPARTIAHVYDADPR